MPTTPNMNLTLPDVTVTPGPTYATQMNTAVTTVDSHDHTSGKGVLVPTSGVNINADLQYNSNSATELKLAQFDNNSSIVATNRSIQFNGGDFWVVDNSGNQIRITQGGAINVASAGGFGGDYVSAGASAIYTDASKTYTFRDGVPLEAILKGRGFESSGYFKWKTASLAGNLTITDTDDNFILLVDTTAARTITLPNPTLGRRIIVVKDVTGSAHINNITVARFAAETIDSVAASKVLDQRKGVWWFISDNTNWHIIDQQTQTVSVNEFSQTSAQTISSSAFTSLTMPDASPFIGRQITRSTNTLTFPLIGTYKLDITGRMRFTGSGVNSSVLVRLRDTTAGSTIKTFQTIESPDTNTARENFNISSVFQITNISNGYEVQWASNPAVDSQIVAGSSFLSETGKSWVYVFTYLGTSNIGS